MYDVTNIIFYNSLINHFIYVKNKFLRLALKNNNYDVNCIYMENKIAKIIGPTRSTPVLWIYFKNYARKYAYILSPSFVLFISIKIAILL